MAKHKPARGEDRSAETLVKQNGKAERRLLRRERRAERLLAEARARLHKAQLRLERRLSAVSDAEALLRTRQVARVAGPTKTNGASAETVPPSIASASETIARASEADPAADGPIILVEDQAPNGATSEIESPATLVLPPAAKASTRRRTKQPAASEE
jgi:hypothetical protein